MIVLHAEKKERAGKGEARALRREARIPAVVYGGGSGNVMLSLLAKDFLQEYNKGNVQSKLMELHCDGQKMIAVPRAVQTHPVTDLPEHVDFQEVDINAEIRVAVHVKVINDDKCPGLKKGGVLNLAYRVVQLFCLPGSIPPHLVVDVAGFEIGRKVHIQDIQLSGSMRPVRKDNFVLLSIAGRAEEKEAVAEQVAEKK